MIKKIATCPSCHTKIQCEGNPGTKVKVTCTSCGKQGVVVFAAHETILEEKNLIELDFYPVLEPFAYIKILKDSTSLDKFYKVIEPHLNEQELATLQRIQNILMNSFNIMVEEIEPSKIEKYLQERINTIIEDNEMTADDVLKTKLLYYVKREFLNYGKIDPLMRDPNIEDISCDGSAIPIFLYHRNFGSLKSNVQFMDEVELSNYVVKLAQKCGKNISVAEPMLDATMPDGSRIQMTLSKAVTTKGSTFTIRKFRADPITATDLIKYKTFSPEMVAFLWLAVENGINALIAGGTASGKTSTLNALCLFIPRESKIVSIEETREINLPHPNWIPGAVRSGFGEVVNEKFAGEIDLYDLMKAALRQRPEYILVGEIRGKEAYVLFQAMATGHTTYSTVHADSTESLIHRLEGKPIEIPRVMLQSLDIVILQSSVLIGEKNVRRCKQIVEIVDIDPLTKEILTNEVFRWNPVDDTFFFSGKSYILERIRSQDHMSKEEMLGEIKRRVEILDWLKQHNIRVFKDVARIVAYYAELPDELMEKIRKDHNQSESTSTKKTGDQQAISKQVQDLTPPSSGSQESSTEDSKSKHSTKKGR